jgi:hypothetical protein
VFHISKKHRRALSSGVPAGGVTAAGVQVGATTVEGMLNAFAVINSTGRLRFAGVNATLTAMPCRQNSPWTSG